MTPAPQASVMSQTWPVQADDRELTKIFMTFCHASRILEEQFQRFETAGSLSFPVLRDLVGAASDKGLLWWLKDHSHQYLRVPNSPVSYHLLDWGIGYVFHETMKLVEATHQHKHYLPAFQGLEEMLPSHEQADMAGFFTQIGRELGEDIARGVRRTRKLMERLRAFFVRAYADQRENTHFARFLYDEEEMVRAVFLQGYADLLMGLYGEAPERQPALAALSFLEGGYYDRALAAARQAADMAPENTETAAVLEAISRAAPNA